MEFRPTCAIAGCGGLDIYRCDECLRTHCRQHASVISATSAHGGEGSLAGLLCDVSPALVC
jgi:hypothetical protein